MQTERVTFLTTPDHKAALDAFAASNGMSVGHVVREATTRYVVEGDMSEDDRFKLLIHELDEALPAMHAALDQAIEGQQRLRADIDAMLRGVGFLQEERAA
jgi:hypothetical protein